LVPGCLTGESEERETWTAESLRAAILERDLASQEAGFERDPAGRDFGGRRFRSTPLSQSGRRVRCKPHGFVRVRKVVGPRQTL
jgi:hypothetical protein